MIVIFGGAFNPPTVAHREIYFHIKEHLPIEKFIYLPVSNLYTKRSLVSNPHRLAMLKLLTRDLPDVEVSTMEFDDSDYKGTYQTMLRFQEKYQDKDLAFVIGADNLVKLYKWINAKSLLNEFKFIVINRSKTDIISYIQNDAFLKEHQDTFIILPDFDHEVSSSAFRESFDPIYVTNEVYQYIMENELYRG